MPKGAPFLIYRRTKPGKGQGRSEQRSRQDTPDVQRLVEATAKLALRLSDANQMLLQGCGFLWFVSREGGSILPVMFGVSAEWKTHRGNNPREGDSAVELHHDGIQQADQDENLQKAANSNVDQLREGLAVQEMGSAE